MNMRGFLITIVMVIFGFCIAFIPLYSFLAPRSAPMELIREGLSTCGADCIRTDGCVGDDEVWAFIAFGDLQPGESFIYEAPEPCCHAYSKVVVEITIGKGGKGKGKATVIVSMDMRDTIYQWHDEGIGRACLVPPPGDGHGLKYWKVIITNTDERKIVRDVLIFGYADGLPLIRHSCEQ